MKLKNEINENRFGGSRRFVVLAGVAFALSLGVGIFVNATKGGFDPADIQVEVAASESSPEKLKAVQPRPGHSDYLRGLTRRATREGFGKDEVLLVSPQRGPGRDAVAKKLLAVASAKGTPLGRRLGAAGLKAARPDNTHLTYVGTNSYMKVSDDGTKIVYRGNVDDPSEIRRARQAGRMLEKDELEKIGREYIKGALRDFVRVGSEETITFLGVRYMREGNYNDKGRGDEEVVANIALFGREIRGVPVIGSGSKIAVWFANDRQPVGFDIDWPVYEVLRTKQEVLSRSKLNERVRATTVQIDGTDRSEVARFECGYVDLGSSKRGAQIQSGCSIHYAGRNDDGTMWARVEYVPAAEKVVADPKWPLSRLIAGGRTINTSSAEYARYATARAPARDDGSPDK